jgi:formate hydrogenlyase subunit 6/NADH:ubiquinone oxidoreductase subunit I
MRRYDERETLFSRVALKKGTKEYQEFYQKHPEFQKIDDTLRDQSFRDALRGSEYFKDIYLPLINQNKTYIKQVFFAGYNEKINPKRVPLSDDFVDQLKEITKYFGATDVGLAKLTDYEYYSHLGGLSKELGFDTLGKKVRPSYQTAIVYTVEMDKEMMNRAPHIEELLETERAYVKIAEISSKLTMYLKRLGYQAFGNNSEYYLGPMVPIAYDAGLGEIGIANHLVNQRYGNRFRIGAVFTTLELPVDQPVDFGLQDFCKVCALCMLNCPPHSIKHKPREVNGRPFYKFDDQSCYQMWLNGGTDCGICIQSCPFSQGLDQEKVTEMKDNKDLMQKVFDEYMNNVGRRNYTKKPLTIVALKEKKNGRN